MNNLINPHSPQISFGQHQVAGIVRAPLNTGFTPISQAQSMVARVGIFATISREPRQVRKEATVTVISGAEEVPARAATPLNVA